MDNLISVEVATSDVNRWLDSRRIKPHIREERKDLISSLVDKVSDGSIIINDDFSIDWKLNYPIENKEGVVTVSGLKLKPRIKAYEIEQALKGVDQTNNGSLALAWLSILSGHGKAILRELDSSDFQSLQAILPFFTS